MKRNVLISVTNNSVLKNLFFFKEGLLGQICKLKNSDTHFIFVLNKGFEEWAESVFEEYPRDNFSVEYVKVPKSRTRFQKLFYFFYSYLIYTGTTKMLAMMGARPDEPPAGGNKYLAPVKWLIANTFGRSVIFKNRVIPFLFRKIIHDRPYKDVFKKYKPKTAFITSLAGFHDQMFCGEAGAWGVRRVGMVSNWDHLDKYYIPVKVDTFLAQSGQLRDYAIKYHNYQEEQIILVGYPHLDFISRRDYLSSRGEIYEKLGFPKDAKYLVHISGSAYAPDEPEILKEILKWMDEGRFGQDVRLVLRPYSGTRTSDRELEAIKFEEIEKHPRVYTYKIDFWKDRRQCGYFFNIVNYAGVVLVVYSTAALEAAALDKPMVTPAFDGFSVRPKEKSITRFEMREHYQDVIKSGAAKIVRNFDDLFTAIDAYLKDPALDREKRKNMVGHLCYKTDGNASKRILEVLLAQYSSIVKDNIANKLIEKYKIPKDSFVLDIGCGSGQFGKDLSDSGYQRVLSIDSEVDLNRDVILLDDESVEVVTAWQILEHLENPYHAVREVHRVLKKGGLFFVSLPNPFNLSHRISFLRSGDLPRWNKKNSHLAVFTKGLFIKTFLNKFELIETRYYLNKFFRWENVKFLPETELFSHFIIYIMRKR